MKILIGFFTDAVREALKGGLVFWGWVGGLGLVTLLGVYHYSVQLSEGMIVTGMTDQVSWGAYIANFTYLVGVAAAAVMLVIPAYVFHKEDIKEVVLVGEGIAVASVVMCILFVTVDLGRPDRIWHMLPILGKFNFPKSMLAWDVLVLSGYLVLNLTIPFYILFTRYQGKEPNPRVYMPGVFIAILWAISIHTVTAFLFSSNVARPFWHTAVLGPRFLASAFTAGPALIILALQVVDHFTEMKIKKTVLDQIALTTTVALQINLFLLGVELFTEFYHPTEHVASAFYLFFGLDGHSALVPWIWSAIAMNLVAVSILTYHPWRMQKLWLNTACGLAIVGVWIEKGMGLIIPGFVPTPIGEIFEYVPTEPELFISLGIWAIGLLIFTFLAKVAIPIELGQLKYQPPKTSASGRAPTAPSVGRTGYAPD